METNTWASTTPQVVNGKLNPVSSSSGSPITPVRPNAVRSATPATTGGSTSGTVTSARTAPRPRKSTRASSQASGRPSTRQTSIATVEVSSESHSASRSGSEAQLAGQLAPGGGGHHRHQRHHEQGGPERRRHHQQGRWSAQRVLHPPPSHEVGGLPDAHGSVKPASVSACWPSSEVTRSTHSWASSASSLCCSVAMK